MYLTIPFGIGLEGRSNRCGSCLDRLTQLVEQLSKPMTKGETLGQVAIAGIELAISSHKVMQTCHYTTEVTCRE